MRKLIIGVLAGLAGLVLSYNAVRISAYENSRQVNSGLPEIALYGMLVAPFVGFIRREKND